MVASFLIWVGGHSFLAKALFYHSPNPTIDLFSDNFLPVCCPITKSHPLSKDFIYFSMSLSSFFHLPFPWLSLFLLYLALFTIQFGLPLLSKWKRKHIQSIDTKTPPPQPNQKNPITPLPYRQIKKITLIFIAYLLWFIPLYHFSQWVSAEKTPSLQKLAFQAWDLAKDRTYIDIINEPDGTLYAIYWDDKKGSFWVEEFPMPLSTNDLSKSVDETNASPASKNIGQLQNAPIYFSSGSSLIALPQRQILDEGGEVRVRPFLSIENNQILEQLEIFHSGKSFPTFSSKWSLPNDISPNTPLNYALSSNKLFYSYNQTNKNFYKMHSLNIEERNKIPFEKMEKGHYYAPFWWKAGQALFFHGVHFESPPPPKNPSQKPTPPKFIVKLFMIYQDGAMQTRLLASSLKLGLEKIKLSGSSDGKLFAYTAVDEQNYVLFGLHSSQVPFPLKSTNIPANPLSLDNDIPLQFDEMQSIHSISFSSKKNSEEEIRNTRENEYSLWLMGRDIKNKPILANALLSLENRKNYSLSFIEIIFSFFFAMIALSLQVVSRFLYH